MPRRAKPTTAWVVSQLDAAFGPVSWSSHGDPLDGLIQTILSQHTNDVNSERAFDDMRRAFPGGWEAVRDAPVEAVIDAIRRGGLAAQKAKRIQEVLRSATETSGGCDLRFLEQLSTADVQAYLQSFKGVGPKTAACVLMFCLGRPVLPVDTHVHRVSQRVGLIGPTVDEAKAHGILQSQLRDEDVYPYHVQLIRLGRRVCDARKPQCGECPLSERCAFAIQESRKPTVKLRG